MNVVNDFSGISSYFVAVYLTGLKYTSTVDPPARVSSRIFSENLMSLVAVYHFSSILSKLILYFNNLAKRTDINQINAALSTL